MSGWEKNFPEHIRLKGVVISVRKVKPKYDWSARDHLVRVIWANYHRSDSFDYYEDELILIASGGE